jgi:alpha-L-fucosidase
MGGNLLLDIGPKEDGTIPEEQVNILQELGRWTKKHEEAIYGTVAGISKDYFSGPTVLSKDRTTLFLFLDSEPRGPVVIKGLKNAVQHVWVVGDGTKLDTQILMKQSWNAIPGLLYITVPAQVLDKQVTVLAVSLDGPVDLYRDDVK